MNDRTDQMVSIISLYLQAGAQGFYFICPTGILGLYINHYTKADTGAIHN